MSEYISVSVIVPMFNAEKYIDDCLRSIISQSLKNIEIIVIDDKSTDTSVEKVKRLARNDTRIKLIRLKENSGPGIARNTGIRYASGKYCMFMDADDTYIDSDSIEFIYKMVEEKKMLVACCDKIDFDNQEKIYIPGSSIRNGEYICSTRNIPSVFWYTTYIYNRNFLIKKKIFFPEIKIFEDPVFLAKVLNEVDRVYCSDRLIYVYRLMHKKKHLTLDNIKTMLSAQEEIRKILSDDYNIWKQQYTSLINIISDGKLYKIFSPDTIACLQRIKKIIRSFPERFKLKSNICYLLVFAILLTLGRGINFILPVKYKKTIKNFAKRLRILE